MTIVAIAYRATSSTSGSWPSSLCSRTQSATEAVTYRSSASSNLLWSAGSIHALKGVVFAKFMCATLSTLRTGCMAQSGGGAGTVAASEVAVGDVNPTWRRVRDVVP